MTEQKTVEEGKKKKCTEGDRAAGVASALRQGVDSLSHSREQNGWREISMKWQPQGGRAAGLLEKS